MRFRSLIGALALAGIVLAPSAALAQATKPAVKADDSALKSRIETRLKGSPALKDGDIDVSVDSGVVTLTGTVHSVAQSVRAGTLAKVEGVTNVENKLTVDSKTTRAMDKAGDKTDRAMDKAADKSDKAADKADSKMDRAGNKTAAGAKKVGRETKNAAGEVGEAVTDGWITTKLKADFVNESTLKGSSINVDTNDHVVTLKGTVTAAAGRARAVEIAKTTKGVSRVIDTLTIAPAR